MKDTTHSSSQTVSEHMWEVQLKRFQEHSVRKKIIVFVEGDVRYIFLQELTG